MPPPSLYPKNVDDHLHFTTNRVMKTAVIGIGGVGGFIDTPINKQLVDDTQRLNRLVEKIPLRRAGSSDEVGDVRLVSL